MDAGDLLEVLITSGVNIVLSGHKHVPYVWRLENMYIANAGTVSSLRLRGYTKPCYNVLEFEGDEVKIHRRFPFGGGNVIAHFSLTSGAQYHRELESPGAGARRSHGGRGAVNRRARGLPRSASSSWSTASTTPGHPLGDRRRPRAWLRGGGGAAGRRRREARPDEPLDWACRCPRSGAPGGRARRGHRRATRPRPCSTCPTSRSLGYRERMELAAVSARRRGSLPRAPISGSTRPCRARRSPVPTLAVIGTGKRDRQDRDRGRGRPPGGASMGWSPVVVAMGRGGPPEPAGGRGRERGPRARSLALVRAGEHAAVDYLEDALTTGVTTIGARRAGGGLAGAPYVTNVREAAELAVARDPGS